ncbi:MAG: M23 family metallopeptidase [Lysobacteraceae bacterium]
MQIRASHATLAVLIAASLITTSQAGKVYKYVDENGITHYSDRPPAGQSPEAVETLHYRHESQRIVTLRLDGSGETRRAVAFNRLHGPVEVELTFSSRQNVHANPSLPLRQVIPAQRETGLARFEVIEANAGGSFELGMTGVPGDPSARHQDVLYALPVPSDSGWRIDQGFNGGFSHQDDQARYAIDINVDEGEAVLAARGGLVMQVEDDFEGAGLDLEKFATRANFVRVLHDDGSMGVYAHLQTDSMQVRAGTRVSVGQTIARAGNTGYSTGPHLHFAVQVNTGMALKSVPFRMAGPDGGELSLGR